MAGQVPGGGSLVPLEVYQNPDPVFLARFFLGKQLRVRDVDGEICGGLITETEAYGGAQDRACHGYGNRNTKRTAVMFGSGGRAYMFLCYGIHWMLNFVTGVPGVPTAILIRSIHINQGQELVARRRRGVAQANWSNGPGRVCAALGLTGEDNGASLLGPRIWVEELDVRIPSHDILVTPRIGVDYAGEWAKKPWRFVWQAPRRV